MRTLHITQSPATQTQTAMAIGACVGSVARNRGSWSAPLGALLALACAQNDPTELRGRVDGTMMKQVADALNGGHRDFTVNSSNGGNILPAMIIATLIKARDGSLTANGQCWSACSLMVLGVERKYADQEADLRIHGAYAKERSADDQVADAAARYMVEHGLREDIARSRGKGINLYRLTPVELAEAGVRGASR